MLELFEKHQEAFDIRAVIDWHADTGGKVKSVRLWQQR
jgi:hypothetical protein